ncbi:MAG: hypothetical protein AAGE96_22615 [Cyanobacteria bacterium P01_G01_bin.19]
MHDSSEKTQTRQIDLTDVLPDIRLINVSEIKIVQEVVEFIETNYQEHKGAISVAEVAALILNRDDVPNLYATSIRGHNNQVLEFQNLFGINNFKIRSKIVPWALDKLIRAGLPKSLNQDLNMAVNEAKSPKQANDDNLLDILTSIDLANVTEFQVIQEAVRCINAKYPKAARRINLSDVCALVLNNEVVTSLYATSEAEYNKLKEVYIAEYQSQVNEVVKRVVTKIYDEGSQYSFSHDSLLSVNFKRRNKISNSWNV